MGKRGVKRAKKEKVRELEDEEGVEKKNRKWRSTDCLVSSGNLSSPVGSYRILASTAKKQHKPRIIKRC